MKPVLLFGILIQLIINLPQRRIFTNEEVKALVDADKYAHEVLERESNNKDNRSLNANIPSSRAALEYLQHAAKDGLCGFPAQVYISSFMDHDDYGKAAAEATREYIKAYNNGERIPPGGPCDAAEKAWRTAWRKEEDPVLASAIAYITSWQKLEEEKNPCTAASIAYIQDIIQSKSSISASQKAMSAFIRSVKQSIEKGKFVNVKACGEAARAFIISSGEKPDPANAAAALAFIEKVFDESAPAYDPVCLAALEAFASSYIAGDDPLTANLKSVKAFFEAFSTVSSFPADSPCAAASIAYAKELEVTLGKDLPNIVPMVAYITSAANEGSRKFDPVCAAAIKAYFDIYIETNSADEANEAAAVAYLEAVEDYPVYDLNGPCSQAAKVYIQEFAYD